MAENQPHTQIPTQDILELTKEECIQLAISNQGEISQLEVTMAVIAGILLQRIP